MSTQPINVVFLTNGTASPRWRIDGIAERVNKFTESAIYVTPWKNWNGRLPEGTDLVVMELLTSPKMVAECHAQGAKVIWEADDALLDTYGKERKNLMHHTDKGRQETIDTIAACDAVTVTNEKLKENYARFTDKPIYVLPNYIDFDWYGKDRVDIVRNSDEIRLGWFGSRGHLEDLQMVTPAIKTLLEKYENLKFVYCGFGGMSSDKKVTEIGWGEDVFKDLPRDRREYHIGVAEDFWPMKHRMLDLDIGIAPLIDDEFNWCKTPIKWMEYGILGTPSVCSPALYYPFVNQGKDGVIASTTDEWVEYLSKLIENKSLRSEIGTACQQRMENEYNIDNHWEKWLEVYKEVLSR